MPLPFFFNLPDPAPLLSAMLFLPTGRLSLHFFPLSRLTCWSRVTFTQTPPSWVGRGGSGWPAHLGKWPAQKGPLFSHPVGLATLPANSLVRKYKIKKKEKRRRCHCGLRGAVHGADVNVARDCCVDCIFVHTGRLKSLNLKQTKQIRIVTL